MANPKDKPETDIGNQAFVGQISREDKKERYFVHLQYHIKEEIYVSTIYKNGKEVDWRVHKSKEEVLAAFEPFFGGKEMKTLRFRE